ncbi:HAD-IA family hydrolase [uncultured Propionibacterium sp.]|uniref:HAD-IA family hydrolase n=1 Tax=uncultured Propionibacterium sp. TaxID=218066 RepID=UPI002930D577|nr:HAD-IA family hydrolase [uncultured Propionibacterium sp.]
MLGSIPAGRWAIFTSGSQELARKRLAAAGIPAPEVLITGQDVAWGKPHPEGYIAAAQGLGVPAGDCAVVEDAAPGIRAARAAGVRSVLGVGAPDAQEIRPDAVVPDLRSVRWIPAGLEIHRQDR